MELMQLRIVLLGVEPEIWRRVVVPDTLSLFELHAVLQGAMGWQDTHLHMFEVDGQKYEVPETNAYGSEEGYADERKFVLKKALKGISEFYYVYDFGDNWQHRVEVESVTPPFPQGMYFPFCIAGENACPPEDCGGMYEYPEFLAVLADPKHPEHVDRKAWAGEFDPCAFSAAQATALIQAICALNRERGVGFLG